MQPTRRRLLGSIAAGTATVVLGSGTALADDDAKVRVAHASPDAPNVDVFLDDAKVLADVSFTTVSSYLELSSGSYEVTIAAASDATDPDAAETVAFQDTVTLDGEDYTAAAVGELTPDVSDEGFGVALFEDTLGVLPAGSGRVRIVHASPDAPAVDVRVVDDEGATVLTLADDIEFGEASDNVEAPVGTYSVAVFPAGAAESLDAAVFGPVDVEVRDGEVLTVFAEGFLTSEPEFTPVLAYEEAAPFGNGNGSGSNPGRGNGNGDGSNPGRGNGNGSGANPGRGNDAR